MRIFTFTVLLLALLGTGAYAQQADSLWSVVWHSPANDMVRVNKFLAEYDTCKPCMDMAEKTGEFKLFRRMRMDANRPNRTAAPPIGPTTLVSVTTGLLAIPMACPVTVAIRTVLLAVTKTATQVFFTPKSC